MRDEFTKNDTEKKQILEKLQVVGLGGLRRVAFTKSKPNNFEFQKDFHLSKVTWT